MKHISIPAQITTVEDRIVGNLTLTQLSLLAAPVFIDFGLYAVLPKPMHLYIYKSLIMFAVTAASFTLAVRLKGQLVLFWAITLIRFNFRSKIYVFNKNSLCQRTNEELAEVPTDPLELPAKSKPKPAPVLNPIEVKSNLAKLNLNLNFIEEKKGRLYVYVSENE